MFSVKAGDLLSQGSLYQCTCSTSVNNAVLNADLDIQLELLLNNVTLENYQAVVGELSSIANQSVVSVVEQTESNLARIATVFNSVASLVANTSAIIVENVSGKNPAYLLYICLHIINYCRLLWVWWKHSTQFFSGILKRWLQMVHSESL